MPPTDPRRGAVLIPVKAFKLAKGRLSPALEPGQRASLAQQMATHVVTQQSTLVAICCDDQGVADWATELGARVIWCPGTDLNGAVQQGFAELGADGIETVAIAHSDLPQAGDLQPLLGWPGVTIVPDRHRTGTNVMALPTSIPFTFSYGTDSFGRHVAEASRHGRGVRIVHDDDLGWDIDRPDDLDAPDSELMTRFLERPPVA